MAHPDAEKWNKRYQEEGRAWLRNAPNSLLVDHAHLLPARGLGLDVAAGVGVNSLFLGGRGLHVIALDISEVGLRLAQLQARRHSIPLDVAVIDLADIWLPESHFDIILNFRYLGRASLPALQRAVRPGGLILFEAFVAPDADRPKSEHYLGRGELLATFEGWHVIYRSLAKPAGHGGRRPRMTEKLVARRPG